MAKTRILLFSLRTNTGLASTDPRKKEFQDQFLLLAKTLNKAGMWQPEVSVRLTLKIAEGTLTSLGSINQALCEETFNLFTDRDLLYKKEPTANIIELQSLDRILPLNLQTR
jgi:hypothetical protein